MEYFIVALLFIVLVLLLLLLLRTNKPSRKLGEEEIFRLRDGIRQDTQESFSRFQASLDRDMAKVNMEIKAIGERMDLRLSKNEESMNSFMTNVMDRMRRESELSNERSLSSLKSLEGNFDRIREENRVSFHDFSEKTEKLTLSVKEGMDAIKKGNEEKLKEIQNVVDQKLQETLDKRISTSFKAVTENLEKLYESMGSLNTLTNDVEKINSLFF